MNLTEYDIILLNTSAGKDSQAMLDVVYHEAREQGVSDRIVCFHADLGRVEWPGTAELAEEHAWHYGLRFVKLARRQGDLLEHIEARGMFPSSAARYCTSDHKRAQAHRAMTMLVGSLGLNRPAKVLDCLGFRREESPFRAKKVAVSYNERASGKGTVRQVTEWLPILEWRLEDVWERIRQAGTRPHPAYAAGMPRLSCSFCVLASKPALVRAAQLRPELAETYRQLEVKIDHRFRNDLSMGDIIELAKVETVDTVDDWNA